MQLVPLEQLADTWPKVSEWIESSIPYGPGDENLWDIFIALARGQYALWVSPRLAAVVQTVRQPRQSVCTILYVGGEDLDAMREAFEFARGWCRANSVQILRVHGREGWQKALALKRVGVILQERI